MEPTVKILDADSGETMHVVLNCPMAKQEAQTSVK